MNTQMLGGMKARDIATGLGTIGAICWTSRLALKAGNNWRRRKVLEIDGLLSRKIFIYTMSIYWVGWGMFSQLPLGIYAFAMNHNAPMALLPHINVFAMLVFMAQLLTYEADVWKCVSVVVVPIVMALIGSFEATFIPYFKSTCGPYPGLRCTEAPMVMGLVFLAAGWWPLYMESLRHQGRAVSVSWVALTFGICGSTMSLLSMMIQQPFNRLNIALYAYQLGLESGLLLCHAIWWFRTRKARHNANLAGMTFDELAYEYAKRNIRWEWARSRKWTRSLERRELRSRARALHNTGGASDEMPTTTTTTTPRAPPPRTSSRPEVRYNSVSGPPRVHVHPVPPAGFDRAEGVRDSV